MRRVTGDAALDEPHPCADGQLAKLARRVAAGVREEGRHPASVGRGERRAARGRVLLGQHAARGAQALGGARREEVEVGEGEVGHLVRVRVRVKGRGRVRVRIRVRVRGRVRGRV